jgi:hypothetical protein
MIEMWVRVDYWFCKSFLFEGVVELEEFMKMMEQVQQNNVSRRSSRSMNTAKA